MKEETEKKTTALKQVFQLKRLTNWWAELKKQI